MAAPESWSTRRLGVVGGPAFFFTLCVVVALSAPDVGTRLTYLGFSLVTGYFLARAWRVGVELTETHLVVRDLFRTHRIRWSDMREARLEPMRTASPLKNQYPYVTLAVDLTAGRTKRFEGVSTAKGASGLLATMVDDINRRISAA